MLEVTVVVGAVITVGIARPLSLQLAIGRVNDVLTLKLDALLAFMMIV